MKRFVVSVAAALVTVGAQAEALRLSKPVEVGPGFEVFGAPMPDKGPAMSLGTVLANEQQYLGETVMVRARIAEVCQKKGCFLMATDGSHQARVTFKDYSFFVPTDSRGDRVTLRGVLSRELLSAKDAAHYATDLGADNGVVDAPTYEYRITAESALIRSDD